MSSIATIIRLLRPHQWLKNVFVFTGVLFGHAWSDSNVVLGALLAFVGFSLVASSIYIFNDLCDLQQDRNHPRKRTRPLASGAISSPVAIAIALPLLLIGYFCAYLASPTVLLLLLTYSGINVAYSLRLKHIVILDVFLIASGFMLRILAGTLGLDIPPSSWLLLCGLMVTLFLGFAKRYAEIQALESDGVDHRRVLEHYTQQMLSSFLVISASGVILSYSLYTMNAATVAIHQTENLIYTVPFIIYSILRYLFLIHRGGKGEDPARDLPRDPHIACAAIGWLVTTVWLIS